MFIYSHVVLKYISNLVAMGVQVKKLVFMGLMGHRRREFAALNKKKQFLCLTCRVTEQRRLSSALPTGALIQRAVFKLPFLLFQCLFVFSRGGLGVGEKPARGELVRSTRSQACGAWGLARRAEPTRRAKKENFSGAVATAPHQRAHQVSRPR